MNYFQIENDAIIAGLFLIILTGLFFSSDSANVFWKKLYGIVPPLLFCYLIPGFLNSYHIINGETSGLYSFATKYLLPASLILLLSTANLKAIFGLGNKADFFKNFYRHVATPTPVAYACNDARAALRGSAPLIHTSPPLDREWSSPTIIFRSVN
jgi:hypothetical protein